MSIKKVSILFKHVLYVIWIEWSVSFTVIVKLLSYCKY